MYHALYVHAGVEVQLNASVTLALRGGKQSVSCPCQFHHPPKEILLTHWIRDLVGTRVSLEESKDMCNTTHLCLEGTSTALNYMCDYLPPELQRVTLLSMHPATHRLVTTWCKNEPLFYQASYTQCKNATYMVSQSAHSALLLCMGNITLHKNSVNATTEESIYWHSQ